MTPSSSYLQAFHSHVGGGTAPTMGVPPLELTAGLGQLLWQQQHSNYADQVRKETEYRCTGLDLQGLAYRHRLCEYEVKILRSLHLHRKFST